MTLAVNVRRPLARLVHHELGLAVELKPEREQPFGVALLSLADSDSRGYSDF